MAACRIQAAVRGRSERERYSRNNIVVLKKKCVMMMLSQLMLFKYLKFESHFKW